MRSSMGIGLVYKLYAGARGIVTEIVKLTFNHPPPSVKVHDECKKETE